MASLHERMSRLFDEPLFRFEGRNEETEMGAWHPAVDMFEKDDHLVIKAELPGMDKKDISLDFKDGVLTLSGVRKHENEVKEENFYRREMSHGKFVRSFSLPADSDTDKIKAGFQNGVLTIEIPKPKHHKPKQITVN
jgi:HSP20 family protein